MGVKADWDTAAERLRRSHAIEWHHEWQYKRTWVFDRDHPGGWKEWDVPPAGNAWEINDQVGDPGTPGRAVIDGASGRMLLTYWRRKK